MIKKNNNYKDTLQNLALISQIGISMITPILLGVFIGQVLDNWLGTKSFFTITLIILGAGTSFMNLFKLTGAWKNKRK
ncbi:MAG: AtpZ/AtpI family protein [Tissierella sp.]|nr:AtpZ/AtpI family protein [Tissierella sp.]